MTYQQTPFTATYKEWEDVLIYMQEVRDPYHLKHWLSDVLERTDPETPTLTLPTYGAGATLFIGNAIAASEKGLTQ